jgi:hypothetical protein
MADLQIAALVAGREVPLDEFINFNNLSGVA